jgi:hypothetical protein
MAEDALSSLPDWASAEDEASFESDLFLYGNACCKINSSGLLAHIPLTSIQDDRLKEMFK